jgi:hypothetical protein
MMNDEHTMAADAWASFNPNLSDKAIAGLLADYIVSMFPRLRLRTYCLSVTHDVRPAGVRKLERMRKVKPDYQPGDRVGPCSLPYDWSLKNIVGISTRARVRARRWAVEATCAGYCVFRRVTAGTGYGRGSLADLRKYWRFELRDTGFEMVSPLWLYPELDISSCVDDVEDQSGAGRLAYYADWVRHC